MLTIEVTERDGSKRTVNAEAGMTLLEAIRDAGIDDLMALCGGCCSCATCHVYVGASHPDLAMPSSSDEDDLLESTSSRAANSRLSCQIQLGTEADGLSIVIAPED